VRDVALLWRESPNEASKLTSSGPSLLKKNPCRSSARHQRVPSKASSKPPGSRGVPGTERLHLVHARRAAATARVRCSSAWVERDALAAV
jgi:hypothetical protein